jgi:RNA polymerase I-specific transcription initiation factor RRN3
MHLFFHFRTRRIHAAFATIIRLCPKAKTELFPILSTNAPFHKRPVNELVWYYRQCLAVLDYLPLIRGKVLELLIERCLDLDVEIRISEFGEVTIEDNSEEGIFQLDMEEEDAEQKKMEEVAIDRATIDEMADKLDSLMLLLFEYSEKSAAAGVPIVDLYSVYSRVFDASIVVTHKSKFVQFLILHLCGLEVRMMQESALMEREEDPIEESPLYREFSAKLIDAIIDPYRATFTRQTGACYLASFISRSEFVCAETAAEAVDALLRWAEAYIEALGPMLVHAPEAREQCSLHSLFYTVCQSAFYIMCFRGGDVMRYLQGDRCENSEMRRHLKLDAERWTRICNHALLPLRYCLESVRTEFLRLAKMFCIVEESALHKLSNDENEGIGKSPRKKKRVSHITTAATLEKERLRGGVGGLGRGSNPLDSFFPFDPYLLCVSHSFIESFYRHWDGGASVSVTNESMDENTPDADAGTNHDEEHEDDDEDGSENEETIAEDEEGSDTQSESGMNVSRTRQRLLSYASNATSVSSHPTQLDGSSGMSPSVASKRTELGEAWKKTLKRSRASSVENGSW